MAHCVPPAVRITFSWYIRRLGEFVIFLQTMHCTLSGIKPGKCPEMTETLLTAQTMHCREIVAVFWCARHKWVDVSSLEQTHIGEVQTHSKRHNVVNGAT